MSHVYELSEFRSGGFMNRTPDMGRVYIDLPIREARELQRKLNTIEPTAKECYDRIN